MEMKAEQQEREGVECERWRRTALGKEDKEARKQRKWAEAR